MACNNDLFSDYDFHQLDDLFDGINFDLLSENALLDFELKVAKQDIKDQAEMIRSLKRRLDACEHAILWCGESCLDEVATNPVTNFKKIKTEAKAEPKEVIDLTNE